MVRKILNNFHNFIFRFVNNISIFVKIKINLTTSAVVKNIEKNVKKIDSGTMGISKVSVPLSSLRVAGVAVGGRDLNWERIPLAEGRPGV